jgi:AcrR family transcriptional regulator
MNTRERIIETAVVLFNDRGTKRVTTNHIAQATGISPGNLYYHFRNKEEIIRTILEHMNIFGQKEFARIQEKHAPGSPEGLAETFLMIQKFNWKYRFFKRELTALVMDDRDLRKQFGEINRAHLTVIRGSIEAAIAAGFISHLNDRTISLLAEEIWLVNLFWLNYLEVGGEEVGDATLKRGIKVLENIVSRYMREEKTDKKKMKKKEYVAARRNTKGVTRRQSHNGLL